MISGFPEIRTPTDVKWNGPTEIFGGVGGMLSVKGVQVLVKAHPEAHHRGDYGVCRPIDFSSADIDNEGVMTAIGAPEAFTSATY